jgi:eukaryotic-like serine/threonine-protein kinase
MNEGRFEPGTRLGRYEVVDALGSGGMSRVYRATDTRLGRTVALKVLSPDPHNADVRVARFEREARAVSQLSHPHVCTLYDIAEDAGVSFLIMEYLEGETLAKRLERGPLPLSDTLRHGIEICGALAHAHRHGVVHRDVKPSNVFLTAVGAKLLDFGIAKNQRQSGTPGDETLLQLGATLTVDGALVGTVQYMAPEQLEGLPTDWRTDVFAVGLVLYEMVRGRPAFEGRSAASVIARVLSGEPEPVHVPDLRIARAFDATIARCLTKKPDDRWQSADDLRGELQWMLDVRRQSGRDGAKFPDAAASLRETAPLTRFFVEPPQDHGFVKFGTQSALSPDGRYLAFVAAGHDSVGHLWIRALEMPVARRLPDTAGAAGPFWAPDSRQIAFFTTGTLKRIGLFDDRSSVIGEVPTGTLGSGAWNTEGLIIMGSPDTGLLQLPAGGGKPVPLTLVDRARDRGHTSPQFLGDGRRFLFLLRTNDSHRAGMYLSSIDHPDQQALVVRTLFKAEYAEPGSLVFLRDRSLWAQPFDVAQGQLTGEPRLLAERVAFNEASGRASFSTSHSGVVAYHAAPTTQLVWYDRTGRRLSAIAVNDFDADPAISPDGRMAAFSMVDTHTGKRNLWAYEAAMNRLRRVTDDDSRNDLAPVWSPDGRSLAFASDRATGSFDLYATSLDDHTESLLYHAPDDLWPLDWSRDGEFLLFRRGAHFRQLWALPLRNGREPGLLVSTTPSVAVARLSPDGRWLAYVSSETGKEEVFVRAFPSGEHRVQVSHDGGAEPIWCREGRELVYLTRNGTFMAVPIRLHGNGVEPGDGAPLFRAALVGSSSLGTLARNQYDVTGDGQRLLVNVPSADPSAIPITVVVNWTKALGNSAESR